MKRSRSWRLKPSMNARTASRSRSDTAAATRPSGPVALLVLLARAAPAGVVAADLLPIRLDLRGRINPVPGLRVESGARAGGRAGGGGVRRRRAHRSAGRGGGLP